MHCNCIVNEKKVQITKAYSNVFIQTISSNRNYYLAQTKYLINFNTSPTHVQKSLFQNTWIELTIYLNCNSVTVPYTL